MIHVPDDLAPTFRLSISRFLSPRHDALCLSSLVFYLYHDDLFVSRDDTLVIEQGTSTPNQQETIFS